MREPDEYAREHIPGARLVPLSAFNPADFDGEHDKVGVFHCNSGNRTGQAAAELLNTSFSEVYHLTGGIQGWKKAGLRINSNKRAPLPIQRQVQITAGSMVVLGVVLGVLVNPWFYALSAFVGAGLTFAGVTGTCALATILGVMPWNRPSQQTAMQLS